MNKKRPPWIPPYSSRKYFSNKIRETEEEIRGMQREGKWIEASRKQYSLRQSWWGYKKYL